MKIAILSNVTVEVLAGMLKKEHQVWLAPGFGAWMETSLNVPTDLKEFGPEAIYILLDRHFENARTWTEADVAAAMASLRTAFPKTPIIVPDIAAVAADFDGDFYDDRMWKLGSMPFSMKGLREIRKIFGIKKVLALDLDNTLWSGVIGEDGASGVVPNIELQKHIKTCKDRGGVLAILSKNNPEDVEPIWDDPRMILKKEDFVSFGINWEDKAANIVKIASELNLGTDSFVFVDDNPAERAQMRAMRPEVCVAEFPPKLDVYFPVREMTAEDLQKTAQYQAETARKNFAVGLSAEEYLKGLEIWTDIHPIQDEEIPRVAQLSQKTNQFNVCTNRYSEDEIRNFAHSEGHLLVTLHAGDKFGDQGLVAFVLVELSGSGTRCARILDWVMSCRVMNRRIEFTVQAEVERLLRGHAVGELSAAWYRTQKNAPVKELFERFGFDLVASNDDERSYVKTL